MKKSVMNTISVIFSILAFVSLLMPMFGMKSSTDNLLGESGASLFKLTALSDSALSVVLMIIGIVALVACVVLVVCVFMGKNKTLNKVKSIISIVLIVLAVAMIILGIVYVGQLKDASIFGVVTYSFLTGAVTLIASTLIAGVSGLLSKFAK